MRRVPKLLSWAWHQNGMGFVSHNPSTVFTMPPRSAHILPPRTVLGLITLSCLGSGSSICAHFCCGGNQNAALPSCMCGCICVCVCVCSTGLAKRGTSVHILDIHFYCNRKHLGQMLACSEVTCGFETGHSFPISAWEPKERETIKWGHNCFLPPFLKPPPPVFTPHLFH